MGSKIVDLIKLAAKVYEAAEPIRNTSETFETVTRNLEVSPPMPNSSDELTKIWATLQALDEVVDKIEKSQSSKFNVFSKDEVKKGREAVEEEKTTLLKIKGVAQAAKIAANDLLSIRTPTGVLTRLVRGDYAVTSLEAGREPMVDEINSLADRLASRCEKLAKTKANFVNDTKWILEMHNLRRTGIGPLGSRGSSPSNGGGSSPSNEGSPPDAAPSQGDVSVQQA
jgi:hypothetical protein